MRILIVSAVFPPYDIVGALRVGKTAKYLSAAGHDVRVLATRDHQAARTMPVEFPPEHVTWARCYSFGRPAELAQGGRDRILEKGRREGPIWRLLRRCWKVFRTVAYVPDAYITWHPFAVRAALALAASWRPDVILASGPPATGYLVGRSLSRRLGVPWAAELRDLWVDDPLYDYRGPRRAFDRWLETRVLGAADGLVVATGSFAEALRPRFKAPIEVVYNSLDPGDLPEDAGALVRGTGVRLVFTGEAKIEVCDYDALFEAFRRLAPSPDAFRLVFIGRRSAAIAEKARAYGVEHLVEARLPVTYAEALEAQCKADALLLMNYSGDVGFRYMPAKLFEYIFARRPILLIGPDQGEAAEAVRSNGLGLVTRDPQAIAERLRAWIEEKARKGSIASPPAPAAEAFTRPRQVARLAAFLERLAPEAERKAPARTL